MLNDNGDPDVGSNKITQLILTTINAKNVKWLTLIKRLLRIVKTPYGLEPEIVYFLLIVLNFGRVTLKDVVEMVTFQTLRKIQKYRTIREHCLCCKKDDLSYDFAQNLLNALGLNGARCYKKNTATELLEYKTKVKRN